MAIERKTVMASAPVTAASFARMQLLKQTKPKDVKAFPIFFSELRHRLSKNQPAVHQLRNKRMNMFAFENIVRQTLFMDVDPKLIRAAFRTVEDVFSNLNFNKLLHSLVSSAIGMFARPMRVLQENWRDLRSIKEGVAEKLFLACEANMRHAAERMANKLCTSFVASFIKNVKATNLGSLTRDEFVKMAAKSSEFLNFELEFFFGRIFDLVLHHTGASTNKVETFAAVAFVVLLSSCGKREKTQFIFEIVDCDDDLCLSVNEVTVYFELLTQWSGIARNDSDAVNLDSGLLNFELSKQQAKRLAEVVVPTSNPSSTHLLINYGEVSRALKFIDHLVPGLQNLRWLLPDVPPYEDVWAKIVRVRAQVKHHNYGARRRSFLHQLTTTHGLSRPAALAMLQNLVQEDENFWNRPHQAADEPTAKRVDSDDENDFLLWKETEETVKRKLQKSKIAMDPVLELRANINKLHLTKNRKSPVLQLLKASHGPAVETNGRPLTVPHSRQERPVRTPFEEECATRAVTAIRGQRIKRELSDSDDDSPRRSFNNVREKLRVAEVVEQQVESFEALTFGKRYLASEVLKPVVMKTLTPFTCFVCKAPHRMNTLRLNE